MAPHAVPEMHQSLVAAAPAAAHIWQLAPGRAMALQARHTTELVVSSGCVWATFDGPHDGPLNERGDLVLQAGSRLRLTAGQRLVVESLGRPGSEPVQLAWERQRRLSAVWVAAAVVRGAALGALRGALAGARAAAQLSAAR